MTHIHLIGIAEPKDPEGRITKFPYAYPVIMGGLRKTSHTFDLVDTHMHKLDFDEIMDRVDRLEGRVFGISGWSHHYPHIKALAEQIRARRKDAVIVVGGVIAGNDDVLMANTEVDIVATGAEGEHILPQLLDCIEQDETALHEVQGITFRDRKRDRVVRNDYRSLMSKSEFQIQERPDFEFFDDQLHELVHYLNSMTDVPVKGFPLLLSRGCPFACTYCGHLYGSKFLRREWDGWFDEVEYLIDRYKAPGFYNFDTNMFLRPDDVDSYCETYKARGSDFEICAELRPTFGDQEMYQRLYEHGVTVSLFGFETGSEKMLVNMKRPMQKMRETRDRIHDALQSDMVIWGNFVFGTPGENRKTMDETRKFMTQISKWAYKQKQRLAKKGKLGTSGFGWTIFLPSPTSELYDLAVREGVIANEEAYLNSLGGEENMEVPAGSKIKIALAMAATHDVNMSEFTSKDAMVSYVHFTLNMARFLAGFPRPSQFHYLFPAIQHYVRHWMIQVRDLVQGREGYFGSLSTPRHQKRVVQPDKVQMQTEGA